MASTYVNDLRLNEMATGDASGTWGTTTNTNLELIAEAFGYGTEAITTNADTHTSTIADGATDPARAMYIKYTGTLDSACTITIGPNTLSRVHIIENATSGSQNIIIKQASSSGGDMVTIAPGTAKVVYLDGGAGSATVQEAFAHLAVPDLTVEDDLTLNSDSSVINMGAGNDVTFTHDGTTGLTIAANPITLDSGADIVLDAEGADVIFKDGGTTIATLSNVSSDFVITTGVQDKDFIIKGDDGGSPITALTIDMSGAGAATFNNDVTAFSDERLKEDIQPIIGGLEKVMQLQGVTYKRNDVSNPRTQIGVIAQQIESILPEVVLTAEDEIGTKSVDYAKMTAVLIEAVKELNQEVTQLKQQITNGG